MKGINWKLRLQNKTILKALISQGLGIIYLFLSMVGIVPRVGEEAVTTLLFMAVEFLTLLGIVVDPTTEGIKDSNQALSYDTPKKG